MRCDAMREVHDADRSPHALRLRRIVLRPRLPLLKRRLVDDRLRLNHSMRDAMCAMKAYKTTRICSCDALTERRVVIDCCQSTNVQHTTDATWTSTYDTACSMRSRHTDWSTKPLPVSDANAYRMFSDLSKHRRNSGAHARARTRTYSQQNAHAHAPALKRSS